MKHLFAHSILVKLALLAALTLLAGLPLSQISGLIDERGASRLQAKHELAASHAGPQLLAGPILVIPYVERWTEEQRDEAGKLKSRVAHRDQRAHLVFPEKLDLNGTLTPEERYRGIFTVLFYDLKGSMAGRFPAFDPSTIRGSREGSVVEVQTPVVALGVSDVRGFQGAPKLVLAGEGASFLPRVPGMADGAWLSRGIHAPLPAAALESWKRRQGMDFQLDLALVGQERLGVVPLAGETTAHLASHWPHPSFGGQFLAARRTVNASGFQADWAVSSVASSARAQLVQLAQETPVIEAGRPLPLMAEAVDRFEVSLVEPLNVYALISRAVKYGLLFVALTLMAAFLFELFRELRLHPVQYGLVALSIALFFLLLLALSEKVSFAIAYASAALASIGLLGVYFSAVLQGVGRGASLAGYVGVLYAALYGLLSSEDNALLLGALLLFGLLGVLMIATRRVDWYAFSAGWGEIRNPPLAH